MTVAAPHNHVAWIAVTSGRVVGPRIATCEPGPTPRTCNAAAIARASAWSSAHEIVCWGPSVPAAEPRKVIVPGPSAAASRRGAKADNTVMPVRLVIGA